MGEHQKNTTLRVLVVDDNVDSAESIAQVLSLWGYEARTAYDGLAAIDAARSYHPRVILLDIGLPKMDGWEVAQALRKDQDLSGMMLIALTGYGTEEDRRRSKEAGIDLHFTKPVDLGSLRDILTAQAC
jgi:CheY-like chemotaxis protein